jgi:hypothetical protein
MRTATLAILGSPFACWALYGCLVILGVGGTQAIAMSIGWGVLWLAIAHLGRRSWLVRRRRRSDQGRGAPGGRGVWTGAVLGTFFLPIPLVLLSLLVSWLHIASSSMILPLFAMVAIPAPSALWWMVLRPTPEVPQEALRPLGWRKYTPHVAAGIIPPRGGPVGRD